MTPQFKTVQETAELLRVDHRTIRAMIERGDLRAVRVGRQFRIPNEAIDELVNGKGQQAAPESQIHKSPGSGGAGK